MTEYRNLARVPRRGFSANTFPISERRAPLGVPLTTPRDIREPLSALLSPSSPHSRVLPLCTCPSGKFPRIALSRRITSRCSTRTSQIRARITWREMVMGQPTGRKGATAFLRVLRQIRQGKRERERSCPPDLEHRRRGTNLKCRSRNCLAIIPRRGRDFPGFTRTCLPELFRIRGALKEDIRRTRGPTEVRPQAMSRLFQTENEIRSMIRAGVNKIEMIWNLEDLISESEINRTIIRYEIFRNTRLRSARQLGFLRSKDILYKDIILLYNKDFYNVYTF